eukprot:CAMPEP_0172356318 /NCGR_PEP_ID=MMETSP1060-20121228/685_1 /TAXON_ID=37318 /ORGANISM="Pseudo-nitzschia pungens, Strain cf. cingulata" /LENGTH=162 /DNA_ID=CAMNT_0013076351 /DNA_START=91 /DNA_END=575 /DNA_ORIENTATION=-
MAAQQTIRSESTTQQRLTNLEKQTGGDKSAKPTASGEGKGNRKPPAKKAKLDQATLNMLREHVVPKEDSDNESGSKPHRGRNLSNNQSPAERKAFMEAKRMLADEARLAFPDFTKPFHLYSDASDRQLGATVCQDGKPLGFYTRKLNSAQLNYTVGEKELLG